MNEDTRTLIEMSLRVRSIEDTAALLSRALSGESITVEQIARIRRGMVERGVLSPLGIIPSHTRDIEPESNIAQRAFETAGKHGSQCLHAAIMRMFTRKAMANDVSVEAAQIATLYSHQQIARRLAA